MYTLGVMKLMDLYVNKVENELGVLLLRLLNGNGYQLDTCDDLSYNDFTYNANCDLPYTLFMINYIYAFRSSF